MLIVHISSLSLIIILSIVLLVNSIKIKNKLFMYLSIGTLVVSIGCLTYCLIHYCNEQHKKKTHVSIPKMLTHVPNEDFDKKKQLIKKMIDTMISCRNKMTLDNNEINKFYKEIQNDSFYTKMAKKLVVSLADKDLDTQILKDSSKDTLESVFEDMSNDSRIALTTKKRKIYFAFLNSIGDSLISIDPTYIIQFIGLNLFSTNVFFCA